MNNAVIEITRLKGEDETETIARAAYEHPLPVRLCHWLNAISLFVLIGSVIAAIVCALVAATKGRNPFGWGILGLFFSILTLIVVIVIPSKK